MMPARTPRSFARTTALVGLLVSCSGAVHAGFWGSSPTPGPIPFTTYSAEKAYLLKNLPCKWVSLGGKDGAFSYDVMCKGGNWATVSLLLNEDTSKPDGLARARLLFREWSPEAHPGGGEAYIAQQFLQYALDHFVPADISAKVGTSFWGKRSQTWQTPAVQVAYTAEKDPNYTLHRLDITGIKTPEAPAPALKPLKTRETTITWEGPATSPTLPPVPAPLPPAAEPKPAEPVAPQPTPAQKQSGLTQPATPAVTTPAITPVPGFWLGSKPAATTPAPITPDTTRQGLERPLPAITVPSTTLTITPPQPPVPAGTPAPTATPQGNGAIPTLAPDGTWHNTLKLVPVSATEPEPESLKKPTPAPLPSTTLVPGAADTPLRGKAPTNFENYNKAEELTRAIEEKAGIKSAPPKVTATQSQSGLAQPAPATAPQPQAPAQDPTRPLPQLKFIPKAQPLEAPTNVIQFEDEKSKI